MKLKKTSLATALVAALAMGAAGQASASVYAGSRLLVENFDIDITNLAGPALTGYTFTTATAATLNGVTVGDSDTCGTINGPACVEVAPTPVLQSTSTLGAPVRNAGDFSFFGPGVGNTYSGSGAEITETEIIGGGTTSVKQIAETELAGSGAGNAESSLSSTTNFTFDFTIAAGELGDLTLSFNADPDLFVAVNTLGLIPPAEATARISASFNLVGNNGTQVSWAPDGVVGAFSAANCEGVTSCAETADSESLNITRTLFPGNPSSNGYSDSRFGVDPGMSAFGITITGLREGSYTFTLTSQALVTAQQRVPEPGTLLLIGGALAALGIGGVRRRRGQQAA
ncbi:MAG TPA: EDSAP-1 family PEP-CTERM protein [Rhodocyclaceae bacterium]|nr:EDSAP-1 family PEP-CTERM protein [Rhodocyclaceae bacterium]